MELSAIEEFCQGECENPGVLVLIRLADQTAAEIFCRYLPEETVRHHVFPAADHCLVVIQSIPLPYIDRFLHRLDCVLDDFNESHEPDSTVPAEVVEARLVPGHVDATEQFADKVLGKHTLVVRGETIPFESGMAFGSGSHPSTRLMLCMLQNISPAVPFPENVLDVGCGSGVLSIVAAKLGAQSVIGTEICRDSIATARKNIGRNGLRDIVTITDQPVAEMTGTFDLILANLAMSVLQRLLPCIVDKLRDKGSLLISGIQGQQAEVITGQLAEKGFTVVDCCGEKSWKALRLQKARAEESGTSCSRDYSHG